MDFKGMASILFGSLVDRYADLFVVAKNNLPKADMKISFRTYISMSILLTLVSYVVSLVGVLVILSLNVIEVSVLLATAYTLFIPILIAVGVFGMLLIYPSQKVVSRSRSIEVNLPFVLTHMGAIAESGIPPYVIFKLISQFEEYGEISKEMKKIVRNVDRFGIDPLSAVKEAAERTPSDSLKQILLGFVTTTESGGDIKMYLKSAGQQSLFEWRIKREKFLQQLSAYAEFYTGLLIAAPLFIIALFAVMNMIQPDIAGFNILDLTQLSIYLIVPALNTGFLIFLRGVEVEI